MNIKIYQFESHRNKKDSRYYEEILMKNDAGFYLLFEGNKGSKYGMQSDYKVRKGRKGRFDLSMEQVKDWIIEKQAESKNFERARLFKFKNSIREMKQEQRDRIIREAWNFYIRNNMVV